jgi:integrase
MAVKRLGYGKNTLNNGCTPHGFRSCASTFLREEGHDPRFVELQLAHTTRNKVEASYNHAEHLKERREMMQFWSDYLEKLASCCAL